MQNSYGKDNKERVPFEYYRELFSKANPKEMSVRCNIPFDEDKKYFCARLMGENIKVFHPDGKFIKSDGSEIHGYPERILLLRYLSQLEYFPSSGKYLTYRDSAGGSVYFANFEGRCIKRLAHAFGYKLEDFTKAMERLKADRLDLGDAAYEFEFIDNMRIAFILWGADDEYPPSAQILFGDNMTASFTAEDLAVACDLSISKLKQTANNK